MNRLKLFDEGKLKTNFVECLACLNIYEEKETFIDACPQCGNKDKEQTYYLTPHYKQQKGRNYK